MISLEKDAELDLSTAQKIFGYFDKSNLIELFSNIFEGEEKRVLEIYRTIYDQGVEPTNPPKKIKSLTLHRNATTKNDDVSFSLSPPHCC